MMLWPSATTVAQQLTAVNGLANKQRALIQLAAQLPPFEQHWRSAANEVYGCESQVWLVAQPIAEGWSFAASSDARIVRGLLVVALAPLQQRDSAEILAFDFADYLQQLGLAQQFSPSRISGLHAIHQRVLQLVQH